MSLHDTVRRFVDAFSHEDLDAAMAMFADDAEYHTFDGKICRGKPAIWQELEPQFRRAWGRIEFIGDKLIVDEAQQTAVVTWWCQHYFDETGADLFSKLRSRAMRVALGRTPAWYGADILEFENGLVRVKRTFAQSPIPLFRRQHG
ncbi:SnoaL-like protein [Fluviicoccus keumensis]|uniref:SnoaL-like protein n=1 Tax=Fluviicoccus keumensis TaxID=1435465 RepID=A0A4Q7YL79_9GAMM|nr:nuclear transport factor 2 family protein [Fluviicoccus keumensis]RZU38307.1 SnoaL-like protein [Fluviicoccus keumensis]